MLDRLLYLFGYAIAPVLFFRAETPEEIVERLRFAYRLVGVRIEATETVEGTERTLFMCPYRNLLAGRYGEKRFCHDTLDLVDDGYVTYLARHKDIDYQRPRGCPGSERCFSEVSAPDDGR